MREKYVCIREDLQVTIERCITAGDWDRLVRDATRGNVYHFGSLWFMVTSSFFASRSNFQRSTEEPIFEPAPRGDESS